MADYTILVADYDPVTTELATTVFSAAGFTVHVAKDGLRAVEAFKKHRPVLTLIEFMMPKKAGLEVCRELRHSPEGRDAPLVVMSSPFRGRAFRADAVRVYGASETVEKPLNKEKLDGLIERLVRPRVAQRAPAPAPSPPAPMPAAVPAPQVAGPAPTSPRVAPPPVTAAAAPAPTQEEATVQALRDVVSAVLGSALVPGGAAAPSKNGEIATPPKRAPVAAADAGDTDIEDHIDTLLDF